VSDPIHEIVRPDAAPEIPPGTAPVALTGSEESLRNFLELLRVLDETGILRTLRDLVEDNQEVVRVAVDFLSRPENVRAIQSTKAVLLAVQKLDPKDVETAADALVTAFEKVRDLPPSDGRRKGTLSVLRELGEPDTHRGLMIFLEFLNALGRQSRESAPKGPA
jgi:uncharacterized protein YjgD (DUF1641 family)